MYLTPKDKDISQEDIDKICEDLWKKELKNKKDRCPDCDSKIGDAHDENCDVARCLSCKGQRLSCDCLSGEGDIWDGLWPGIKDCYEQKLICYDTMRGGGWRFDLNELARRL